MGNFAIVRVEKVKTMSSLAARGRHNFREQDTPNAASDRTCLNVIEGAKSTDELLKAVSDLLPTKRRKDAVIGLEYLITASPEMFGADWAETKSHGQNYFKDAIAWLEAKHGKGNVVCKTVHLDESTPHLAAFVVPLLNGKLNAKAFTGGAKVLAEMQTSFAEVVGVKHGLQRGIERSKAVHQDNAKIRPMVAERIELRRQVKVLMSEVERLSKSVSGGNAALLAAQEALAKLQKRYEFTHKTNVQFLDDLNKLTAENKELAAINAKLTLEAEERKTALEAPESKIEGDVPLEDLKAAQEALLSEWKPIREANKGDIANGRVVASVDGLAILHIGRGVHVQYALPSGVPAPQIGKPIVERQKAQPVPVVQR